MVKSTKRIEVVEKDYMSIRLLITKSTHKALRVKSAYMDMTVKEYIMHLINKGVKDTKRDIEAKSA